MNNDPPADLFILPLILLVLAASVWAWWRPISRVAGGNPLLDLEPRAACPWGLLDLIIAFFLWAGCGTFLVRILATRFGIQDPSDLAELSPDGRAAVLFGGALAMSAACVLSIAVVRLRTGAGLVDLGIDFARVGADLQLGFRAFVMLAPIVYGMQIVLVKWFESKHPLIELLKEHPDPWFFVLSGIAALIVAPLAEEYFFRVLLQGWFEQVAAYGSTVTQILLGGRPDDVNSDLLARPVSDQHDPRRSPDQSEVAVESQSADYGFGIARNRSRLTAMWPIALSAFLFAMAHSSHGPDPIPLFVLAVGLGYLYQRTHRILPCIVVHFLLNSCSMAVLCLLVYFGE